MKKMFKKALVVVVSIALLATVMLPCFNLVSSAEGAYVYDIINGDATVSAAAKNGLKSDFKVYHTGDVSTQTLTAANFEDYFDTATNNVVLHKPETKGTDQASAESQVTTLVYDKQTFKNFELVMRVNNSGSYSGDNAMNIGPSIIFGIEDATKWDAAGYGYEAYFWGSGAGFSIMDRYTTRDTAKVVRVDGEAHINQFGKFNNDLYIKIKVEGQYAVTSWGWASEGLAGLGNEVTIPLGSQYQGGYVGLAFPADDIRLWYLSIEDTAGKVTLDKETYNWSAASTSDFRSKYEIYHRTDALNSGLTKMSWEKAMQDGFVKNSDSEFQTYAPDVAYGNIENEYNDYITTMINTSKKYREFHMRFKVLGQDGATLYPAIIFGVNQPQNFGTPNAGWVAGMIPNSGDVKPAIQGYDATSDSFKTWAPATFSSAEASTSGNSFYGSNFWYWVDVTVKDGKVTLLIDQPDWMGSFSYTTDLPSTYTGGYVGILLRGQKYYSWALEFEELGGTVVEPEYEAPVNPNGELETYTYNLNSLDAYNKAKTDFDVYYSNNASAGTLAKVDFEDHFELGSGLIHKPTGIITGDGGSFWELYGSNVTTMLLNKQKFRDFKMVVTGQGSGDPMGDWKSFEIMLGVQDPTKWESAGMGFMLGYSFNLGNATVPFLYSYTKYATEKTSYPVPSDHSFSGHFGAKYNYTRTITVKDNHLTYTEEIWGCTFKAEYDLANDYTGGYVGLKFMSDSTKVFTISIKDLGGTVFDGDVTDTNVVEVLASPVVEAPTATLKKDVSLPTTVKVRCDDDQVYEIPVDWEFNNYNRFKRGDYVNSGVISDYIVFEKYKKVIVGEDMIPQITVRVTGDKDLEPINLLCVGDSITYGDGPERTTNYPSYLQEYLGGEYNVINAGLNAATLLTAGDTAYVDSEVYRDSLTQEPDIVCIMLGTNDSKPNNWIFNDDYKSDYTALINAYKNLESNPLVYVLTSPYVAIGNYSINARTVAKNIVPLQKEVAEETGCSVIDIFALTDGKADWYADGVHPTSVGYSKIAYEVARKIALPAPLQKITLSYEKLNVLLGDTETIGYTFSPINVEGDTTVTWTSSNESVATVEDGKVKGLTLGTTTVTAECQGKTASVEITVIPKYDPISINLTDKEDLEDFDSYYADDANNGMVKNDDYSVYWDVDANGITRTTDTIGSMAWGDSNVASLVYNVRKFHNFKMTVDMHRAEQGQYMFPMVVIGIKDPTAYYAKENGGIAIFATAEGGIIIAGNIEGTGGEWQVSQAPADASGYNRTGPHTFEITVEYQRLTVKMLPSRTGEPVADPITVQLGETDMDGYIALVGRANPCGFKNLSITPLEGKDPTVINVDKVYDVTGISTAVGTEVSNLALPETVKVKATDGNDYTASVTWSYDGYNRYVRDTYTLTGTINDAVVGTNKIVSNGKVAKIDVTLYGDADLIVEGEFRSDFITEGEMSNFKCYYTSDYAQYMEEYDWKEHWNITDGYLQRNHNIPNNCEWTVENATAHSSSLIYTGRKYKNFELNVDYMRHGTGFWWAMAVFGVQDPTKHPLQSSTGGITAYAQQEGNANGFYKDGWFGGAYPKNSHAASGVWHHLRVIVQNGTVTIYVNNDASFTKVIPESYRVEGYVGIMCNQQWASFKNFAVKPLPDDTITNAEGFNASEYPELTYAGDSEETSAELYYSNSYQYSKSEYGTAIESKNGIFYGLTVIASLFAVGFVFTGFKLKKAGK